MKKLDHLKNIFNNYDHFIIDLWGVVHNGVKLNEGAMKTIEELYNNKKNYIFLSNAPRPVKDVRKFLIEKMQINKKFLNNILTSGEAAINSIKNFDYGKFFFHLGPERDSKIFEGLENHKTELQKCDYILCTGLYDDEMDKLNFYEKLLENSTDKKMICTNPDLIVDRGGVREFCAGSVAMVFEKMGGEVVYFGKPYPEVYNLSIDNKNKKILSIGDNLNTDIKGANLLNYDSLLISNGIHKNEIKQNGIEKVSKSYEAICNYIQSELKW